MSHCVIIVIMLCVIAMGLGGCAHENAPQGTNTTPSPAVTEPAAPPAQPAPLAPEPAAPAQLAATPVAYDAAMLTRAYNGFGLRLFTTLQRAQSGQNAFISPMSIAVALGMTYNGARNQTQQAMAETLGVPGMARAQFNQLNSALLASLDGADPTVELAIANSLWARADIPFIPAFLDSVRAAYHAELANVDFLAPGTCARINRWVESATRDRIKDLVKQQDMTDDTILVLINAIYFKGKWTKTFDRENTQDLPFTLADGSTRPHPLMSQSGSYHYYEDDQIQAIRLPYGKGRLSMRVILPARTSSLAELCASLDETTWRRWNDAMVSKEGTIKLPRFKMEYEAELSKPLAQLGMGIAFDRERADFADMATIRERICISAVRHKSFVEVNEEGTEAAAATAVVMMRVTAAMPMERFMMVVDRPFLFAICDDESGMVLFLGGVMNPG